MKLRKYLDTAKRELGKNQPKRLNIWTVIIILLILIDEWAKEGYVLNPEDFTVPSSHEFALIIVVLISFCLNLFYLIKRR